MKSLEEINKIREEKRKELDLRVNLNAGTQEKHILVCRGTGCTSSKSPKIIENFRNILKEKNIENVRVIQTGCFGLCAKGFQITQDRIHFSSILGRIHTDDAVKDDLRCISWGYCRLCRRASFGRQ